MVGGYVHPITRIGVGGDDIPLLIIWFVSGNTWKIIKSSPVGPSRRHPPEFLDMAHLEMCFIFLFTILSDTITQDDVEVRHIILRKVGLPAIHEIYPGDETTTYLSSSGPVKDWPPKLQSV